MKYTYENIKLAALDLDGTLLQPDGTLSPRAHRALVQAIACGIEIVAASGRAFATLPKEVLEIQGIRYAITSNGAAVNEVPGGKRIAARCLKESAVREILEIAGKEKSVLEVFVDGVPYADRKYTEDPVRWGCPQSAVHYVRTTRRPVNDIEEFISEHADSLDSIDFICKNDDQKNRLIQMVTAQTDEVYITSSVPHLLEISAAGGGKGNALKTICQMTGIDLQYVAACGNADNDADMLKIAGVGAAVSDASLECLAAADVILGSCSEDGVAMFLEELVRIS